MCKNHISVYKLIALRKDIWTLHWVDMASVLRNDFVVKEFELESNYYVHFQTWERYEPPYQLAMG